MAKGTPGAQDPPAPRLRLDVRISGRVQGVFFRASTREEARRLGLSGWVRNLPGGGVEARFEGPEKDLRRILSWCRTGPPGARVDGVEESWGPSEGGGGEFSISY